MKPEHNAKPKLHTVNLRYPGDGTKPISEYYYGDDKPADWPITITKHMRFIKGSSNESSR